jgi:hypothetical protein
MLVPKKDGSIRFHVDYWHRKDAYPLPCIKEIFDQLDGTQVFTSHHHHALT